MAKRHYKSPYRSKFLKGNEKNPPAKNEVEDAQIQLVDDLNEFAQFREEILPMLREDLNNGMDAKTLYEKYSALAAARNISIALTAQDPAKATAAVKDILDRAQGKPTEHKEVKHKFEELPEEELDAILKSELQDVAEESGSKEFNN